MSESKDGIKYRVVLLPAGFSGCAWWRIRNPMEALSKKHKDMSIHVINKSLGPNEILDLREKADLFVLQAPGARQAVQIMDFYKEKGKALVVDYDDFSFDLSPFNPRYQMLGMKEVMTKDKDGNLKPMWRDGFKGFDIKSNQERYKTFERCCDLSDSITTTTPYLAGKFKVLGRVDVLPNSIDFKKWVKYPRPKKFKDEVRIGWFGGDSHYKDLEEIADIFPKLMEKYPNVKLVLFTPDRWPQLFGKLPQDRIEYHPWADLSIYPLAISTLFCDIGLVPIEPNEFGKCKSNIKWLEFAAVGTPSVCTDSKPYNVEIRNWENGVVADNKDFYGAVAKLVENKELREYIAKNAYEYARKHYDLETNCSLWYNLYKEIIENNRSCVKKSPTLLQKLGNKLGLIPQTSQPIKSV